MIALISNEKLDCLITFHCIDMNENAIFFNLMSIFIALDLHLEKHQIPSGVEHIIIYKASTVKKVFFKLKDS